MKQIIYLFRVEEEYPDLNEEHLKEYECLSSTIFWQFSQAENLEFEVATASVVLTDEWLYDYFEKYFKYDTTKTNEMIVAFMKAEILTMGVKNDGK